MGVKAVGICDDVKVLREGLGLTQEELARLIGVSARTVSRWENGESEPTALALKGIRRWQQMLDRLEEVFTAEALPRWFHLPNEVLGGRTPFEVACTVGGEEEILNLLGRLEWSIPG